MKLRKIFALKNLNLVIKGRKGNTNSVFDILSVDVTTYGGKNVYPSIK
jgi:hypothetical protein